MFSPQFFELIEKADPEKKQWFLETLEASQPIPQAKGVPGLENHTWVKLPDPPSPIGINHFPASPVARIVGAETLPDVTLDSVYGVVQEVHYNRYISIDGKWDLIVQGTATSNTPFQQTVSVTTGTSTTASFELSYSVTASASILFATLETSWSATFGMGFSWSEEKTISQQLGITSNQGAVSVCWWQGVYDSTYSYNVRYVPKPGVSNNFVGIGIAQVLNAQEGGARKTVKFKNKGNTFIPTQYPVAAKSLLEPNKFLIEY